MDNIFLNGMKFYSYHGVFQEENKLGQIFIVDAVLSLDLKEAGSTDDLEATINYGEVYDLIDQGMKEPSKLLEHVAERISTVLFSKYHRLEEVKIKITKQNPPIAGHYDGVGIEIHRVR
ncbi:dihydroneopterin aldolase [Macrococcus hajekii]|nr:dihydroneopterin aldolase [Macrococcus hajekii]